MQHLDKHSAAVEPCAPCDIPAFCRSNYYQGKLLTERDLSGEQRYFIDKMRLHYVALHGWGVVCGLVVRPHPRCPDRVVLTEGFAIDECGREIRLLKEEVVLLPQPPEPPPPPCPPEPCDDDDEPAGEPETRRTYYICLRYRECAGEYMPVPFDECGGTTKKPNRICEGFEIQLLEEAPACLERAHKHRHCGEEDCERLYQSIPEDCPPPGEDCCIPLAVIRDYEPGEPLTSEMIDNSIRPIVPTGRLLQQLIHCVMEKLPKGRRYTHIKRFSWRHDHEYSVQECHRSFIGSQEAPLGFEVEFSHRVSPKGINTRTFEAMIVREPMEPHEGRRVEYAPARVVRSEDGLRATLQIDPEYARHHLNDHNFDLYITLKCDKVVDERGVAVDGTLQARILPDEDRDEVVVAPTGDGVAGGTFESWIRVRRGR